MCIVSSFSAGNPRDKATDDDDEALARSDKVMTQRETGAAVTLARERGEENSAAVIAYLRSRTGKGRRIKLSGH